MLNPPSLQQISFPHTRHYWMLCVLFVLHWMHVGQKQKKERNEGSVPTNGHFGTFFATAAEKLLRGLYVRSSRRALCRSEAWVVSQVNTVVIKVSAHFGLSAQGRGRKNGVPRDTVRFSMQKLGTCQGVGTPVR